MGKFWRRVEAFFDALVVPALLMLVVLVVADLFFTEFKYDHEAYFFLAEALIIFVFVGDLSFKFKRAASWKGFLRREWLEIIAVIPFFWVFRVIESVARVGEIIQEILHLIARGGRLARLFAALGFVGTRDERFSEFIQRVTGSDRFREASKFFRHPWDHED